MYKQPLAEVFGHLITDKSDDAIRYRTGIRLFGAKYKMRGHLLHYMSLDITDIYEMPN